MAINKNHEFEDLGGIKCAIVEKNTSKERVAFLKDPLEKRLFLLKHSFQRWRISLHPNLQTHDFY